MALGFAMTQKARPIAVRAVTPGRVRLRNGAIFLAVLAIGSTAYAETIVRAGASYTVVDPGGGSDSVAFTDASPVDGDVSVSALKAYSGSGGSSSATAGLGILKAAAVSGAVRGNIFDGNANIGRAYANATWSDVVSINGSGLSGTGTANIRLLVTGGSVSNDGTAGTSDCCIMGDATASLLLLNRTSAGDSTLFQFDTEAHLRSQPGASYAVTRVNGTTFLGNLNGFWDIDIPFTFSEGLSLFATVNVDASGLAGSNSSANSYANFGNSIYWGGINSISLANGSTTTDFSAVGSNGHDWKVSAVPEPASFALLLTGLSLLGARHLCLSDSLRRQG